MLELSVLLVGHERSERLAVRYIVLAILCYLSSPAVCVGRSLFEEQVAPLLARRCLGCHNSNQPQGDLSLETSRDLYGAGYVVPRKPDSSYLLDVITPSGGQAEMPRDADPLTDSEVKLIRQWIQEGAVWPEGVVLTPPVVTDTDWWSLRPLVRPRVPDAVPRIRRIDGTVLPAASGTWNEIDAFICLLYTSDAADDLAVV